MPSAGSDHGALVPSVSSGEASENWPSAIRMPPMITALRWPMKLSASQPPNSGVK